MNKTKEAFERPICEALVVRFEGVICVSVPGSVNNGDFSDPSADVEDDSNENWGW